MLSVGFNGDGRAWGFAIVDGELLNVYKAVNRFDSGFPTFEVLFGR